MSGIAALYLRRSSADDENPGASSEDDQRASGMALARAYVPEATVEEYRDWNYSGSRNDRPELNRLEQDIRDGRVAAVFASELTRLGRGGPAQTLPFFELCKAHSVKVVTKREGPLGVDSPFGEFVLTILSAFARLEHEMARARSAGARQALRDKYRAVGLAEPSRVAPYGWRNVRRPEDGLLVSERDPNVDLNVIVEAYETAKSVRGTAALLNHRGIPSPMGKQWSLTPMRGVLERLAEEGLIVLPQRNQGRRRQPKTEALFAGLLRCHCGARMTPNVTRGQYYCHAARTHEDHGRMSVTEKALLAVLRPAADEYVRTIRVEARAVMDDLAQKRTGIERRQAALDARLDVDRITPDAYKKATLALRQELADLEANAHVSNRLRVEKPPSWDDAGATNQHLRRIWTHVQLDPDMTPEPYWRSVAYRYDPEQQLREEAELRDAEAAGLTVLPVKRAAS